MPLTDDELAIISDWRATQSGYGRDDPQTTGRVRAIARCIWESEGCGCEIVSDDGLANYFVLFAYQRGDVPSYAAARKVDGYLVYLSACAPFAVVGRSRKFVADTPTSCQPLEIEMLIDPDTHSCSLAEVTIGSIRKAGYQILTPAEVSKPLPPGVTVYEYSLSHEPWDRLFHALFANTD